MLDVLTFFKEIEDSSYCIVKMSDKFPQYNPGEDIDVLCYSVDEIIKKLLSWGNKYVDNGFRIEVKDVHKKKHIHVDFYLNEVLQLRFDLYGELPVYNKTEIKPALFESVIENAINLNCQSGSETISIRIPSDIDDMLMRYLEFIEWYDVRPDKINHLDYIMSNLTEYTKKKYLDKLHHYTKLPPKYAPQEKKLNLLGKVILLFKSFLPVSR